MLLPLDEIAPMLQLSLVDFVGYAWYGEFNTASASSSSIVGLGRGDISLDALLKMMLSSREDAGLGCDMGSCFMNRLVAVTGPVSGQVTFFGVFGTLWMLPLLIRSHKGDLFFGLLWTRA